MLTLKHKGERGFLRCLLSVPMRIQGPQVVIFFPSLLEVCAESGVRVSGVEMAGGSEEQVD